MAEKPLHTLLTIAGIAVGLCLAGRVPALETPPVEVVVDSRMVVRGAAGDGLLPVAVSQDWSRPLPNVTRAVIIVHGAHRTAEPYFRIAKGLAPDNGTLIVAPQFLLQKDTAAHAVPENVLRWGPESWEKGGDAAGPVRVSSYEAIDALLLTLADRSRQPNLRTVVLAGFSGGGQLVQRYAAVGRVGDTLANRGIALRYVVGSPSSYLYFSDDRPLPAGGFGPFTGAAACPDFNRWHYGLAAGFPRYIGALPAGGAATLERRYAGLDVVYLLGTADNDAGHWELDKSCAGEAEGPDRYTRGVDFFRYMQARDGSILRQRFWSAPGAAHNPGAVFGSSCGRTALFDISDCRED
jgi:hypothetical protein